MRTPAAAVCLFFMGASALWGQNALEEVVSRPDSVIIRTDSAARYRSFMLGAPQRLVVELENTKNAFGPRDIPGEGRFLKGTRVSQFKTRPYLTRVVLDLSQSTAYKISEEGGALSVSVGEPVQVPTPAPAPLKAVFRPLPPKPIVREEPSLRLSPAQTALLACAAFLVLAFFFVQNKVGAGEPSAAPPDFTPENTGEMIQGIQENLNSLARRLSILEKKFSQLPPHFPSPASPDQRVQEELAELKTVVKSLAEALQLPKPRGN